MPMAEKIGETFRKRDELLKRLEALQPLGKKFKGCSCGNEESVSSGNATANFRKDRQENMSKPTFNDRFSDKRNLSRSTPQDISSPKLKPPRSSGRDVLRESESVSNEGRKQRPSSWDDSDNELPLNDEMPTTESGRIFSAEAEETTDSVAFNLDKVKEQFLHPFKDVEIRDSTLDLSEFSSPESKTYSNLRVEIDRRQTPARVRRRTRSSSSSPTQDTKIFQELTAKTGTDDNNPLHKTNEIKIDSNNVFDNLFSKLYSRKADIFNVEWSDMNSKGNSTQEEVEKSSVERKDAETHLGETASEDFHYCRTLRKLSQILEVEEGKKEGNDRGGIESFEKNIEEKLSESSLSPKSSQQFDSNTHSPASTSCTRRLNTNNKVHSNIFLQPQDSVLLDKITNLERNTKGSVSERAYCPFYKNADSNNFVILTPKSAKTDTDINEEVDLEFEKLRPDLTNYSYVDSAWTENFLKDLKSKESQENLHLRISIPTSEETSPRKKKDSSQRSIEVTGKNSVKRDFQLFKTSPISSANVSKSSSRSLKVEDVKTPNSESTNDNVKRGKRREKIKKSFPSEINKSNRHEKSPKSFDSTTEEMNLGHQKSAKMNLSTEEWKTDNFKLKNANYTSPKLTESSERSQSGGKSSEENLFSKLEKSRQNSASSTKNYSPQINKNDWYSSSESFKKDSERSIGSNNSSILLKNSVKESSIKFQRLKSPESDRNSELKLLLSLESPQYQATINTSDRTEDSFRKNRSPEKTSSFEGAKSNSDSEFSENFHEKEKFKVLDVQKPQEQTERNSAKSKVEFTENQVDKFFYKNKTLLTAQEFEEEARESSRSEVLFYSNDKSPKQAENGSRASLSDLNEKNIQNINEFIAARRKNSFSPKSSSRSSARSNTIKTEEEILDREKQARSRCSSRRSSLRALPIIDEMSHEALPKSVESFEDETTKFHSRISSAHQKPHKSGSFVNVSMKGGNAEENENGDNKSNRYSFLEDINKKKRGENSFEEIMWQDLIERFDEPDENFSNNFSVLNKFPGFPRKKSPSQSSRESVTSSSEMQNILSTVEITTEKDLPISSKAEAQNNSKFEIKSEESLTLPQEDTHEKLDKTNNYSISEYNINKDQLAKTFYFDIKMMDNQKIGEFGDVTCCSIGKFEITSSGRPNVYGDGDQGERTTGWDQVAANSIMEKSKKDVEKKPQRQLWTEVNCTYNFEKALLSMPHNQQTDLNFKEYFPMNSFKVLSAGLENYQSSRSVKSLTEEIHGKEEASSVKTSTLNQRLSNSLKNVGHSQENLNEMKLKQSTYTSTGDLFETIFQNGNEEREFSNFNTFLANKKKIDKNVKPKNWLTIGHGKCDSEKTFRKSRLKKKDNAITVRRTSSGRSKPSIPPLRFKNTNCLHNFYKRLISTFCITSHSSAATSK